MSLFPYSPGHIIATKRSDGLIDAELHYGSYPCDIPPVVSGKGYLDEHSFRLSFSRFLREGDSMDDVATIWKDATNV